jgi:alpha-beta hydrolase superfamily lysophospholipase
MKIFEASWPSQDGLKMYARGWQPDNPPKAVICLVHGLGEHIGRYDHVGAALTEAGYALLGFDLRGHGRSGGARGHSPSLEAFMHDIDLLLENAGLRYPELPCFLYGHSLGGLLVLAYVLLRTPAVRGVVITSPGLRSPLQEQKIKVALAKILGSVVPTLSLSSGLDPRTISRDPKVVDLYIHDPLVHDRTTTGFGKAALQAVDLTFARAADFPAIPLLVMHGTADQLAYPRGSEEFTRLVPGNATLKLWEGLFHETHNEPEQAEVLKYLVGWLDGELSKK